MEVAGLDTRTSSRTAPWRRLLAIALAGLVLAACSDPGSVTPVADDAGNPTPVPGGDAGNPPGDATPVMDCQREGYPCSFADVPLTVIERSLALSEEVVGQLEAGADIEAVAATLASQTDVVDVTVDGPVLAFRLADGRPMIVDVTGDQDMIGNGSSSSLTQAVTAAKPRGSVIDLTTRPAAARNARTVRTVLTQKIVGGGEGDRHALVLSPFRYEQDFGNAGELVAAALSGVRGYAGNVTYLATTDEHDPQVTVDVLTLLDDFDVVHVDTHGGTICKDKPTTGLTKDKDKKKCEDGITDFLVQRFHGTADDLQSIAHPGVVHYRGRVHQSIAVTADFFRHHYPDGLADKLFVLGSCNTFRTDMADAIAGERGVYVSWDGYTEFGLVRDSGLSLVESLGLGLTVGEAFARLPSLAPQNPEAQGQLQRTARAAGGDLRIRHLLTVRDNLTGELVTNNSGIEVKEVPGDGQNDNLDLEFVVDGITPEQLDNFYVNLVIEDNVIGHVNLKESGVQVDEFRYLVSTPVPLPFDAEAGQTLDMDFWIPLPDLGDDHYVAAPRVNGRDEAEVGSEWVLSSSARSARTDDVTVKTATVTFELEPDDDPASDYHYFRVTGGSVRIQREYEDALGCRFVVDHSIDIPAGAANNYLKFDASGQGLVLDGFGSVPSETVQTTGSCGDSAGVRVGGVYFVAEDVSVSGSLIQGGYNDGAQLPTVIEWSLSRSR